MQQAPEKRSMVQPAMRPGTAAQKAARRASGAGGRAQVPHPWLFPQCAAVVHHGGAGTTGAGLMAGRPTAVVPAFGDQPFWGLMCWCAPTPGPVTCDERRGPVPARLLASNPKP